MRVRKVVQSLAEKKFFDITTQSITFLNTWTTIDNFICQITQGTTASNRIGNKIFVHSIEVSLVVTPQVAMSVAGCFCRIAFVHNKETNYVATDPLSIFNLNVVTSLRNTPNNAKYTMLRDFQHVMVPTGTDSTGVVKTVGPALFTTFKIFPKKRIDFVANTGLVADLMKDNWSLLYCADSSTGCTGTYRVKVIFSDM